MKTAYHLAIEGAIGVGKTSLTKLIAEKYNARLNSSISSNTNFLILGENPGSKFGKAKKLNVKIAYDLEYIPKETNFIKQMKSINADVIYGYEMFITQAKLSFNIWTGISSNTDSLNAKILDLLGE